MSSIAGQDSRTEYVAGLRALADLLEQHDDLPLPSGEAQFAWNLWPHVVADIPAEMARIRRIIGAGQWAKNEPTGEFGTAYYTLTAQLRGVALQLCSYRETVCERVVTGTREVVEDVPVAFEKRTTVVEDVEWVCKPLLADLEPVSS